MGTLEARRSRSAPRAQGVTSPQSERRAAILARAYGARRIQDLASRSIRRSLARTRHLRRLQAPVPCQTPPIAQPPTPAETIRLRADAASEWASGDAIEAHRQEGGLSFSGATISTLPRDRVLLPEATGASCPPAHQRVASTRGEALVTVGSPTASAATTSDRMPIELLMTKDLTMSEVSSGG